MNGNPAPAAEWFRLADSAWEAAERAQRPRRVSGFWFSLADDADTRLKQYVYDYLEILSPDAARAIAAGMTMSAPDAIRKGLDAIEALGCEELLLVPATADLSEVERIAELVEKR